MSSSCLLLDACVLINLAATGRLEEILKSIGSDVMVVTFVAEESLYIEASIEHAAEREQIDLVPLANAGLLEIVELADDELGIMVDFTQNLDEGEAATLAVGSVRGCDVATDDRAAIRFLSQKGLSLQISRTSTLIRSWAESTGQDDATVRDALFRVEVRARFVAGSTDPNLDWWERLLGRGD